MAAPSTIRSPRDRTYDPLRPTKLFGNDNEVYGAPLADTNQFETYMQVGTYVDFTDGDGIILVPYAKEFPQGVFTVVACLGDNNAPAYIKINHVQHFRTSFEVQVFDELGAPLGAGVNVRVNYLAVGW